MSDINLLAMVTLAARDTASSTIDGVGGHLGSLGKQFAGFGAAAVAGAIVAGAGAVDMAMKYQTSTVQMQNNAQISTAAAQKIANQFLATGGTASFSAQ